MLFDKAVRDLALAVAKRTPQGEFSFSDMHETLRDAMKVAISDEGKISYTKWHQNKLAIFALIAEMVDAVLPQKIEQAGIGKFIEVKNFGHGDKPRFTVKTGKKNVKRFITKVSAAGVYDRVRLDKTYFDVDVYVHGGAVYQTLESFLAGDGDINEVLDIMLDELEESIYVDVTTALQGATATMPAANQATHNGFDSTKFRNVLATVRAYGTPNIFCTQEFAATLTLDAAFVSDADKNDMREQGYIGKYLGAPVVIIPQSFEDETNTTKVIKPEFAYIFPAGAMEAPIKLGFEGETIIRDIQNADWSFEIQLYKKFGIALLHTNYFGIYENTALAV